jgi:hypothetical protein
MSSEYTRRSVYQLLLVVTVAAMTARVANTERVYEPSIYRSATPVADEPNPPGRNWPTNRPLPMPTFGSNDRSRWATIRALVEDGTFVIGRRERLPDGGHRDTGRVFEPGYDSVDKVLKPGADEFLSSKPPLLTVILAGEYWLIRQAGWDLEHSRWVVMRVMVWTANVLPLTLFLWLFIDVVERHGRTEWGRLFTYAAACFGTFLTTFAVTLNNHVPAAVTAFLAVYPWLSGRDMGSPAWLAFTGLFAGLTAAFELPAAALLAGLLVGFLMRAPLRTLLFFIPAALLPIAAQLGLNQLAVGEPWPVYAKIGEGAGTWYDYAGSHWRREPGEVKRGIDWAKDYEPRSTYAFHLLAGHHGVFSLTPVWLLSLAAMVGVGLPAVRRPRDPDRPLEQLLLLTLAVSGVVLVFFAAVVGTVNYGGWTSGARWFFWLAPLWLIALLPAADWLAPRRGRRAFGLALLAGSVFSASFPTANPWRHPWLYRLLDALGYIPYGS